MALSKYRRAHYRVSLESGTASIILAFVPHSLGVLPDVQPIYTGRTLLKDNAF